MNKKLKNIITFSTLLTLLNLIIIFLGTYFNVDGPVKLDSHIFSFFINEILYLTPLILWIFISKPLSKTINKIELVGQYFLRVGIFLSIIGFLSIFCRFYEAYVGPMDFGLSMYWFILYLFIILPLLIISFIIYFIYRNNK